MHRSIVIRVNTHARLQSAKKQNAAPKRRRASRVSSISLFHSPFPSPRASLSASPFLFPDPQLFVLLNAELPVPDGAREGREKKDKKEARRGWIYASFVHVRYTREGNKWSVNYGTLERKLARTPTFYALNLNPVFLSRGGGGGSDRGVCLLFIVPQASCARSPFRLSGGARNLIWKNAAVSIPLPSPFFLARQWTLIARVSSRERGGPRRFSRARRRSSSVSQTSALSFLSFHFGASC